MAQLPQLPLLLPPSDDQSTVLLFWPIYDYVSFSRLLSGHFSCRALLETDLVPTSDFFLSRLSSDDQTFCVTLLSMPIQADLTINNVFLLPPAGNARYTNKHCPPTPLPFLLLPPSPSSPVPSNNFLRATHYQTR
jgi:hypothetical protein